jgi:hypothetical protein
MKYIVTKTEEGMEEIFVFSRNIPHDAMAESLEGIKDKTFDNWKRIYRQPIAAGFVNSKKECYGRSETLKLSSRKEDTNLLAESLNRVF